MGANKRVSRVLSLVLALALVFTMYVPVHAAGGDPNIVLESKTGFDTGECAPGDEVSITVGVTETTLASFTGGLKFDTELFECTSITDADGVEVEKEYGLLIQYAGRGNAATPWESLAASALDDTEAPVNNSGNIGFAFVNAAASRKIFEGTVFTATFKALKDGEAEFYLFEDSDQLDGSDNIYQSEKIEDSVLTITIKTPEAPKEAQSLTMESSKTATVGDEPFSVAATGAKTPVTYTSSDESVVTVDSEGMVTVVGEGTATVTATAAEDETYAEATASCKITVKEKKEVDELSADDVDAPFNTATIETELTGIPEDAEDVEVELSVASGSAIITNLKFDPETGKITGDVEGAAEGDEVEVTVTVTSSNYKEATTTFTVSFGSQAYNIVVTGGKADKETAQEGDTVTITAEVPKGQKFSKWTVASGSAVVLDDATKATTTFTMPGEDVDITAEFVKKSSSGGGSSSGSSKKFTDVPEDSYFYDPVYWAVDKGITKGTSSTKFSPFLGTTRADFVTFLYRAEGSPKVSGETPFEDLDKDAYYYDAVLWAWNNGITIGTSATTFSPSMTVTRGQAVTFLYRHAGEPAVGTVNPFTDVAESDYYYNAILWAVNKKITTGTTETTFEPNRDSYRAEVVTFLYRELK